MIGGARGLWTERLGCFQRALDAACSGPVSHHPAPTASTVLAPTAPGRTPATVRTATVLLVVLAVAFGLAALLFLLGGVAGALTRTDVGPVDPARQLGRLVGATVGVVVPLTLAGLTVRMALAVRARRSWPSRVMVVLAWVAGLLATGSLAMVVWWSSRTGVVSGVLQTVLLAVPLMGALALPVSTAVLLRRPTARAWCDDPRRHRAA